MKTENEVVKMINALDFINEDIKTLKAINKITRALIRIQKEIVTVKNVKNGISISQKPDLIFATTSMLFDYMLYKKVKIPEEVGKLMKENLIIETYNHFRLLEKCNSIGSA